MATAAKQLRTTFEKAKARLEEESLPVYAPSAAPTPMPPGVCVCVMSVFYLDIGQYIKSDLNGFCFQNQTNFQEGGWH